MRLISVVCGISLALATGPALAQAPATSPASASRYSISRTSLSVLLADPTAKAILIRNIPEVVGTNGASDRTIQLAELNLQEIKDSIPGFDRSMFTDKMMAQIEKELAKLPAR